VRRTRVIYRSWSQAKWSVSGNRRVHAANRKTAVIEANKGIYFPRAASKLVYVDL